LSAAVEINHDLFARITWLGLQPDLPGEGIALPGGIAISPQDAARCVLDTRRTSTFLRGLENAIAQASARFPGETIRILYAGCGPFAPFCVLPLLQFPALDVQFTLLDIHQTSLDAAMQLAETLGVQSRIRDYIRCDAAG